MSTSFSWSLIPQQMCQIPYNNHATGSGTSDLCNFPILARTAEARSEPLIGSVFERLQGWKRETCLMLLCSTLGWSPHPCWLPALSHPHMKGELSSQHLKNPPLGRKSQFSLEDKSETATVWNVSQPGAGPCWSQRWDRLTSLSINRLVWNFSLQSVWNWADQSNLET